MKLKYLYAYLQIKRVDRVITTLRLLTKALSIIRREA